MLVPKRISLVVFKKVGWEGPHESHQLVVVRSCVGAQVCPLIGELLGLDEEVSFVPVKME
ncbi:hypothetical protein A2U01_0084460, partial [Trifolium medium]|nr:hypothetical protein [Trifolium medium]